MTQALQVRWKGPIDGLSEEDRQALFDRQAGVTDAVRTTVEELAARIAAGCDKAVIEATDRYDQVHLDTLTVPEDALEQAHAEAPDGFLPAFVVAADQIRAYHRAMAQAPGPTFAARGITAHEREIPVPRAGLYVPGGQAAYPSTVAMTVIPAQEAGVEEILVASPPGTDGLPHPLVLAACHELGVDHVLPVGGAQAILAMATGTETVPRCDVVAGPGNAYVQAAKEHVAGQVRIDSPAGPSEIAVLIHPSANVHVAASELIAQAEHAPDTLAVAICLDEGTMLRLVDTVEERLLDLPRAAIVEQALADQGALLVADGTDQALSFIDDLAPEHCLILHPDAGALADRLDGPACTVVGRRARVPIADYAAGPSHVLPTGGHARAYSGIGTGTFTKQAHIVSVDDVAPELIKAATTLARFEGLEGHARAIEEAMR